MEGQGDIEGGVEKERGTKRGRYRRGVVTEIDT
jgi:hypothetical protein